MGMFDYLRCEMPLPVEWPSEGFQFQTKDTDAQYMERYTITADGRLVHHAVRYEETPQAERPYPDAKPGTWQSICGLIRSVPIGDVEVPMHGDLSFCDLAKDGAWVRFVARFTDGRCTRIWCDEFRAPPPASATDARRAETGTGSVHEGAVGNAETPSPTPAPLPMED